MVVLGFSIDVFYRVDSDALQCLLVGGGVEVVKRKSN